MQNAILLVLFLMLYGCTPSTGSSDETGNSSYSEQTEKNIEINQINDTLDLTSIDTLHVTDTVMNDSEENAGAEKASTAIEPIPESKKEVPKVAPKPKAVVQKTGSLHIPEPLYNFGRVTEGDIVEHTFEIQNTGNADLLITKVDVDCGCTVPEFNKEPIPPSAKDYVKVIFDTTGKLVAQTRYITIYTNGKPLSKVVRLKGMVLTE